MRKPSLALLTVLALALLQPVGCGAPAAEESDEFGLLPDGKADNYFSTVAQEYEVKGTLPVKMTAAEFADEAKREELVTRRITALGLYLTTYVTHKFRGIDINGDGEITDDEVFFRNENYGGFRSMVRNRTARTAAITGDETQGYSAEFVIDMAGPRDLLDRIPPAPDSDPAAGFAFDLRMPKGATMDPTNVARQEIRNFDPDQYPGELETVRCTARPLDDTANAYPRYQDFVVDGVFDITLFHGHDYNKDRYDLADARQAFDTVRSLGFTSPVERFEDLKADSGAFTRISKFGGKEVTIEVRIFHSDMFLNDRRAQHDLALTELTGRDVFFYNGHAGPYYGFYLDEADAARVYPEEFAKAAFTERQQLVVAQGCQTYSQYADTLYAHPKKDESNLDVITSVNYSYAAGTTELLADLVQVDASGNHTALDYAKILTHLNHNLQNQWSMVFYGVTGIDGNPQLHPYASPERIGERCTRASDCGDPNGNVCMADHQMKKRCGAVALSAKACPAGSRFHRFAAGNSILGSGCFVQ